jgi:hypothetical protein
VGAVALNVSHAGGRPILRFDRIRNPEIPLGTVDVLVDGVIFEFDFVKIAVNVVRRHGEPGNRLPDLMRVWFGQDAGLPGTEHRVELASGPDGRWRLRPSLADAGGGTAVLGSVT